MASKAIGFLNFKFGADLSGFERAMKKAQKKLKKFGKSITKTGTTLSRNLTLPILGLAAAALKFGSDLEETDAKFLTVFSSMQKEAEETAKVFKDSFGLSELAAKDMLSGTGDLLVGIGLTEGGALDLSTKINELAVDLASFTNFSGGAKGASDALTKALLGERESIKSLGISINEADLKEFAANQGLVWKELDKGTRAMLTYELAAQQSFKAIGDFERTSGSFANQMRIVKGDLVDVASEMGIRLIPYAQAAIEKLKGLIKWFDGLSDSTKDNIVKWGLILAAIGPVLIIIGKMSIGISALIPIIARLGTFLMANPYILLAAAIAAVVYVIYDLTSALTYQIDVQKQLGDLNVKAQQSISKDMVNIKLLTDTIKDENTSLDDQQKALKTLQETYPGYYDEIDETAISTQNLDAATVTLTKNLMQVAKLTAYKNKLVEIESKLLDLEQKGNVDVTTNIAADLIGGVPMQALNLFGGKWTEVKENFQEKLDLKEMGELEKLEEEILVLTTALEIEVNKTNASFKKLSHGTGEVVVPLKELEDGTTKVSESTVNLTEDTKGLLDELTEIPEITPAIAKAWDEVFPNESKLVKVDRFFERMSEDMTFMFGDLGEFGDNLQLQLDGMLQIFDAYQKKMRAKIENENKIKEQEIDANYEKEKAAIENSLMSEEQKAKLIEDLDTKTQNAKVALEEQTEKKLAVLKRREAIKEKAMAMANIIMNTAQAIMKTLGKSGFFGIPLSFIVAAMGAVQLGIVASTPLPLAEGGLVTGPTTALIGEGVGTSISNPEVVVPLDRLKSLMGREQNQNITVTGKLIGKDIYLSNKNTGTNRFRTV